MGDGRYVHWLHGVRPDISIYWACASSKESFQQSFAEIARTCGIPGRRNPSVDILSLVKMWLQNESHGTWVLVIDNADDPNLSSLQAQDTNHSVDSNSNPGNESRSINLAQFLPDCRHGSVLVTTRNKEAGMKLVPGRSPIEVKKMKDVECAQLIRTMTGDAEVADDKILSLSSRLDFLPLALAQASAFMLENSMTIDCYLDLLDRSDEALVHLLSQPFEAVGRDSDVPHAVMLTWVVWFEKVEQENELASTLLSLIALFNFQAIPKDLLVECWNSVGVLSRSKSLPSAPSRKRPRSISPDAIRSEETLSAVAIEGDNSKESASCVFQSTQRGSEVAPPELTEAMKARMWQMSNTVSVRINPTYPDSHHIEQYSYDMLDMSTRKVPQLMPSYAADQVEDASHQKQTEVSTSSSQSSYHIWSQSLCGDDLDQYATCKEDKAQPKPRECMLPNGRRSTLPIGYSMPVSKPPICMLQFDADLEARFTRVLSTGPSLWEDTNSRVFFVELEKALGILKALCIITEGPDGSVTMHRLVQLAARRWLSKGSSEFSFEREALHAMVRAFPVVIYENLDQCKKMLPHAHAFLRTNGTEASQNVLLRSILYENLARFYINAGQAAVVPQLLQQALAQAATGLEEHDPLVLQMIRIMAVALCYQGRLEASKPWLSRLMALEKKYHDGTHPQMLRAMSALAVCFHMERKYRQAESILTEALRNIDNFQYNHALLNMRIELTVQLVGVLISSRRLEEALSRSYEAVDLMMTPRCYGLDHPVALKNFAAQAVIFREQGEFEKAEMTCRRALEGRDIVSDAAQPYLLSIMEILGKVLMGMHRYDEAKQVYDRIVHIRAETCQPEQRTNSQPKDSLGPAEPEELPIYKLGASVRSFDSSLLEMFEDETSSTSHNAHSKREMLRGGQYSSRSFFQAP